MTRKFNHSLVSVISPSEDVPNCPFLGSLSIYNCGSLKRLPDAMPNLSRLTIGGCEKLESVPEGWLTNLNSLKELRIDDFSAGGGIFSYFVVEKGNNCVTSLNITLKKKMMLLPSEWGLHRFSSLTDLAFYGPMSEEAEEENYVDGMLLPNSLTHLKIVGFPNLKKLFFKDFQNLTSLYYLWILDCPRLESFPEQGLPPSLEQLYIGGSTLGRRCKYEDEYRALISSIPKVDINERSSEAGK